MRRAGGGSTRRARGAARAPRPRGWAPGRSSRGSARAGAAARRAWSPNALLGRVLEQRARSASPPGRRRLRSASRTLQSSGSSEPELAPDEVALRAEQPAWPVVEHVALPPVDVELGHVARADRGAERERRARARIDRQVGVARVAKAGAQDRGHVEQCLHARRGTRLTESRHTTASRPRACASQRLETRVGERQRRCACRRRTRSRSRTARRSRRAPRARDPARSRRTPAWRRREPAVRSPGPVT